MTPIRVLIVDDSALVRRMLFAALSGDEGIEVVGMAPDAYIARTMILELNPDVITLDIEMPRMDGITFLKKLMLFRPLPVIIISSLGQAACQASIDALRAGAVEILAKPNGPYSVGELGHTLADKIRQAALARPRLTITDRPAALPQRPPPSDRLRSSKGATQLPPDGRLIVIGASTGGPSAVAEVLRQLPPDSPPILIVQHMPAVFTRHFAERLDRDSAVSVKEAQDGDTALPGHALVAPGNLHMTVTRVGKTYRVTIADGPQVCFSRPSVDVLFSSVAASAGKDAVGVLLTGMGADGARGLLAMRHSGAHTIAQSEDTCVVFGMPKEAIRMGAAQTILGLDQISAALQRQPATASAANQPPAKSDLLAKA
jgi:two-component system chemotaxis response regulator CheB